MLNRQDLCQIAALTLRRALLTGDVPLHLLQVSAVVNKVTVAAPPGETHFTILQFDASDQDATAQSPLDRYRDGTGAHSEAFQGEVAQRSDPGGLSNKVLW